MDECLSCGTSFDNITIQNCLITEGLHQTHYYHGEYVPDHSGHSMGSLIKVRGKDGNASLYYNLWAHNNNRNPAVGSYDSTETVHVDIRNNVMYDCAAFGYSSGASKAVLMNYCNNYIIVGKNTSSGNRFTAFKANKNNHMTIYQSGNKLDWNMDTVRDGVNSGWNMFKGDWKKTTTPVAMPSIVAESADESYERVIAFSGAYPWSRDAVDERIITQVKTGTGKIINSQEEAGGYPQLETVTRDADWDSDQDGMPNWWEKQQGLDYHNPDDRNDIDTLSGYTHLEVYLGNKSLLTDVSRTTVKENYILALANYPNPFHSVTTIELGLTESCQIRLIITDCSGREVMRFQQYMRAGEHAVSFNGQHLASGIYFYQLIAGKHIQTGKMLHLR